MSFFIRSLVQASGTSFLRAMQAMPPARCDAFMTLYAFCRITDDACDQPDPEAARVALAHWREECVRLYGGVPRHPVSRALQPVVRRYGLRRGLFEELLAGHAMDISGETIRPSWRELLVYCERVAGCVGLLSLPLLGYEQQQAQGFARNLGIALQLTNILRDAGEDLTQGRIYYPRELLGATGVLQMSAGGLLQDGEAHRRVRQRLGAQAYRYYQQADGLLDMRARQQLAPVLQMRHAYFRQWQRMRGCGWQLLPRRIVKQAARFAT